MHGFLQVITWLTGHHSSTAMNSDIFRWFQMSWRHFESLTVAESPSLQPCSFCQATGCGAIEQSAVLNADYWLVYIAVHRYPANERLITPNHINHEEDEEANVAKKSSKRWRQVLSKRTSQVHELSEDAPVGRLEPVKRLNLNVESCKASCMESRTCKTRCCGVRWLKLRQARTAANSTGINTTTLHKSNIEI